MKKINFVLIIYMLIFILFQQSVFAHPQFELKPPVVECHSCILMDAKTGTILYEKNAYENMEPASTTKIMTAILALENGSLSDTVVTKELPPLVDGTRIYLEEGERLTLKEMLYAMLLNSANDAAIAIAEHIGGDMDTFVKMMNQKAKQIGAKNTNFVNPHGLSEEGHLTNAYDLAVITRYALNNFPEFNKIISTKSLNIPWQAENCDRHLVNLNKLLWNYDGADGVKTGYTSSAGQTLVASATRDGFRLIAVVLKAQGRNVLWSDAKSLLDYGFENFEIREIIKDGNFISSKKIKYGDTVNIEVNKDFTVVVPKGSPPVTSKISYKSDIKAPLKKGDILGEIMFYAGDKSLGSIKLVSCSDVKRKIYTYWWFWPCLISLCTYAPFRLILSIKQHNRNKKRVRYVSYIKKYK
ncbi:MAG TPA: D-alanyl-D-alanine carboxypeptidase [Thermoanaerobacterales bacterium]|jgi:D-alanyl-D-alanine carboxypeptidase (penicillin-binding protein 5/6)|nr:D-alanyl-D-alanine carboxypeptidase [Thermoanaerobacterales bacterium]